MHHLFLPLVRFFRVYCLIIVKKSNSNLQYVILICPVSDIEHSHYKYCDLYTHCNAINTYIYIYIYIYIKKERKKERERERARESESEGCYFLTSQHIGTRPQLLPDTFASAWPVSIRPLMSYSLWSPHFFSLPIQVFLCRHSSSALHQHFNYSNYCTSRKITCVRLRVDTTCICTSPLTLRCTHSANFRLLFCSFWANRDKQVKHKTKKK